MFEYQHNSSVDSTALAELFMRSGWLESDPGRKLEWMVAGSEDWVTCTVDGELVGFGRTFRLDATRKVVFDVVVDERFEGLGLDDEIIRILAEDDLGGSVEIFRQEDAERAMRASVRADDVNYWAPEAPRSAYLG
jgi:hypothetical protein